MTSEHVGLAKCYDHHGCRLPQCKAAKAAARKKYSGKIPPQHGYFGYCEPYNCRCAICTEEYRQVRLGFRRRKNRDSPRTSRMLSACEALGAALSAVCTPLTIPQLVALARRYHHELYVTHGGLTVRLHRTRNVQRGLIIFPSGQVSTLFEPRSEGGKKRPPKGAHNERHEACA